jgi:hypothetical protein
MATHLENRHGAATPEEVQLESRRSALQKVVDAAADYPYQSDAIDALKEEFASIPQAYGDTGSLAQSDHDEARGQAAAELSTSELVEQIHGSDEDEDAADEDDGDDDSK